MKKWMIIGILLVGFSLYGVHEVAAQPDVKQDVQKIELSKKQVKELDSLYKDLYKTHKKIIDKYVEYGVFTKDKAEMIKSRLDKMQEELKENNYVPKWDQKRRPPHKEKE